MNSVQKILYVCQGADFAGAESYAMNLIKGVSKLEGVQCHLATFHNGPLIGKLEKENIKIIKLHESENLKSAKKISSYIDENNIGLVHFLDIKGVVAAGYISFLKGDLKAIATVHGLPENYKGFFRQGKYIIYLCLYFLFLKGCMDRVIFVSGDLRRRLKCFAGKKDRVVHNGIDIAKWSGGSRSLRKEKGSFVVGAVGRLEKVKGYEYLLEAAQKVTRTRKNVVFHILGTGSLSSDLKRKADSLGIADHVIFHGFKSDVGKYMSEMDLFVLPSLHEGIPYVLLEAMSLGKPVVCSQVGGLKEVIDHKSDGILVPVADPDAIASEILGLWDDEQQRISLGENARRKVLNKFSSQAMVAQTLSIYGELRLKKNDPATTPPDCRNQDFQP